MFCSNCGKELPENANFCESCGMMVKQPDSSQTLYTSAEPVDAQPQPAPKRKALSGKVVAIIGIIAALVLVVCIIVTAVCAFVGSRANRARNGQYYSGGYNYGYPRGYDDYDDFFGGYGDFFDDYFDDDDDYGTYRGYSNRGGSSGSGNSASAPTAAPTEAPAADSNPLPTDRFGNSYTSPSYEWPTGDGTYEFYAKSTIPKFESVTGQTCTGTETDENGNVYYKYAMDMDAYNAYIKVIEGYGYKQTEFDAQGNNSYATYQNDVQYLTIYLMNSDNEIVIMA